MKSYKGLVLLGIFSVGASALDKSTATVEGAAKAGSDKAVSGSVTKDYSKPSTTTTTKSRASQIQGAATLPAKKPTHAAPGLEQKNERSDVSNKSNDELFGKKPKAAGSDTAPPAKSEGGRPKVTTFADAVKGADEKEAAIATVLRAFDKKAQMLRDGKVPQDLSKLSAEQVEALKNALAEASKDLSDPDKLAFEGLLLSKIVEEGKNPNGKPVDYAKLTADVKTAYETLKEQQADGLLPKDMTPERALRNMALILPLDQIGVIANHMKSAAADAKSSDAEKAAGGKAALEGVHEGIVGKRMEILASILAKSGHTLDSGRFAALVDKDWQKFAEARLGRDGAAALCDDCGICKIQ